LIETVHLAGVYGTHLIRSDKDKGHAYKTIEALRAALAQLEKTDMQIGLTYEEANPPEELARLEQAMIEAWKPIPKKEWVGLTDEEIMDACAAVWASHPIEVGNVVQDLLKEKNT
jgi:hypothetical protein